MLLLLLSLPFGCGSDPHPDRTREAHAAILAQAVHHRDFDGAPFSLIGSCDERGECTESWERDQHRTELRRSAWGRPLGDPVVGRLEGYRKDCEQRGGRFSAELCPVEGARGERISGTSEARRNVARVERFTTQAALDRAEGSCSSHPRPGCTVTRLDGG